MGRVGFEPTTNALKGHCSSTELPTQILQTRFELVRLAPTDFKSVVYTVPPPEDTLSLYHPLPKIQELFMLLTKKIGMIDIIPKRISQKFLSNPYFKCSSSSR